MSIRRCFSIALAGLLSMSVGSGAAGAVLDPAALAALVGIPNVDVTGAYADASGEALDVTTAEYAVDVQSSASPVKIDVMASAPIADAEASAAAGADFPGANGQGGAARAAASGSATASSVVDSVGTGFLLGDFVASGAATGDPFTVTFNFDISATLTLVDDAADIDILTTGLSAFAVVFDAGGNEEAFLGAVSIDADGAGGSVFVGDGDWASAPTLTSEFIENGTDVASDCGASGLPHRCTYDVKTTASVSIDVVNGGVFSLLFGVQSSILGLGTDFELVSDASKTTVLESIDAPPSVTVTALPSQLVPEPRSVALLSIGLLALGASIAYRGRKKGRAAAPDESEA